ncbi:MAG: TonB-dependent hemoglobin/transferrin/lactoferrin family receptor [Alphaproteobacteria bacterium]|nr:MAG: TonB-dependent hemoglobin/transferrin/lactoferrin family receptor [Alphaproteobacteria bacterium]
MPKGQGGVSMAGKKHWWIRCAGVAACIFGSVAHAQTAREHQAPAAATQGSQLRPATEVEYRKILDTISVTATRNPIKSFEYPGMVSVIGREEIQTRQPSTPDDVLKFVPNVEFTGGPRRTGEAPSIRGFSGPDVIVIFDGARQNFGSAHDGRFFIDPSLLKQVEVLRGPASSLYGSGGTGGVIEFRTIDAADFLAPNETIGATVSAGYQTVNRERLGTFTGYAKPIDGLDFVGSVTKRDSGSIELGDGNELSNTDDDIIAGLAKASFKFADHHRIEGSFISFNNDAQEPNNGQGTGGNDIVDKEIGSNTFRAAYSYKNPDDNLFDLDLVTYYTDFQADELRLDALGAGPAGELLKRDVNTVGIRLDNRSRLTISDSIATTFTYGGEFYRDEQDGAAGSGERDGVPDADANFYGFFAQAEVTISEPFGVVPGDFLIIPGVRYDDYKTTSSLADDNNESEVSPRVGVSYLPTDWLMVFANYAHAFRAPTFDELFLTGTHFQIPIGPGIVNRFVSNPNLKPQKTRTVEFGGGLTFDDVVESRDQFQVKASHFRIWGDDFIDLSVNQPAPFVDCNPFIPGNCDGTTTSQNVPNAKLWGTEVEASYESFRFLVAVGFSTIDGKNEDTGEKLGVLTPDQVTVNTGLKLPEIDSILGWRMLAASKFDKVNTPADERDGYAVHDLYFTWQPSDRPLKGLRVDLGVDNAFDKAYSRVFTGATEAGRNFKALISYSLKW